MSPQCALGVILFVFIFWHYWHFFRVYGQEMGKERQWDDMQQRFQGQELNPTRLLQGLIASVFTSTPCAAPSWSNFCRFVAPGKAEQCFMFSPFVDNSSHCGLMES
ncbi:hypothetical protein ATANTOWER_012093 [Ataeniobius toweri]|uniref:Secreted protein n=1 Tax=Ataeniobius toweri TaxID=208326 RepID=A0ABU7AYX2_9TELE|nr:hypothetical protein [Ataeniobius toweri]